jgi:peptidoglycan/LPS O-acetylase OafA/YrhL
MGTLRVALALAVLLTHLPGARYHFVGGGLAVQCFYVISGFYMALVLDGKYHDVGLFYSNRILRLLPTYLVAMGLAAVALVCLGASATISWPTVLAVFRHPVAAVILGAENLVVLGQELLFWFRVSTDGQFSFVPFVHPPSQSNPVAWQLLLVPQSWSLSMELMFYALAPFLARLSSRRLLALALVSVIVRLSGLWLALDYGLWHGRLFPTALFLFLLGMLAHRFLPLAARLPRVTGWVAYGVVLALVVGYPLLPLPDEAGRWLMYGAVTAGVPLIFSVLRTSALDRWIGDLSYPIYLCHLIVVGLVLTYEPPFPAWLSIGGTLILAVTLLLFVEHPVERWRQARVARRHGH